MGGGFCLPGGGKSIDIVPIVAFGGRLFLGAEEHAHIHRENQTFVKENHLASQSQKALAPISRPPSGMIISRNPLAKNAPLPMVCNLAGKLMVSSAPHPASARGSSRETNRSIPARRYDFRNDTPLCRFWFFHVIPRRTEFVKLVLRFFIFIKSDKKPECEKYMAIKFQKFESFSQTLLTTAGVPNIMEVRAVVVAAAKIRNARMSR